MWRAPLVFALCLVGCTERSLEVPTGIGDFALARDASIPIRDGGMCLSHIRQSTPISQIVLIGDPEPVPSRAATRFRIDYPLADGCDVPADIRVEPGSGNSTDFFNLTVYVWRRVGGSCGANTVTSRVFVVAGGQSSSPKLLVRDGSPGGTESITVTRLPPDPGGLCPATVPGATCAHDCDCIASAPGTLCLAGADGVRACGWSCSEDADCPASAPQCSGTPSYRCGAVSVCETSCPIGQFVIDCVCAPRAIGGGMCACDADCPGGTICNGMYCIQPCVTGQDCYPQCGGEGCGFCQDGQCTYTV